MGNAEIIATENQSYRANMLNRNIQLTFFISGLFLAFLFFAHFHLHGQWLIPTDTYYYIALSDSLLKNKELLDLTAIPPNPLVTYQNGAPFAYALLKIIGLDNFSAMKAFSFFNLFIWIFACYPFFKLIEHFKVTSTLNQCLLLFGFFSSSSLLNFQFTPGTDGIFNGASIWLTYLLILIDKKLDNNEKNINNSTYIIAITIIAVSIIIVHFSIRILFYQIAFFISILLCKTNNKKNILILSLLLLMLTTLSISLPYLIFNPSVSQDIAKPYNFSIIDREEPIRIMLLHYFGAVKYFNKINGNILLIIITLLLFSSFIFSLKKKELGKVFISLTIIIFILINFSLSNSTMAQSGARYMISTLPLFCLILSSFTYSRTISYIIILIFSVFTVLMLTSNIRQYCISTFWLNFYGKKVSIPENTLFFTDRARYGYIFLNGRNYNLPVSSINNSYKHIWIAGSSQFINDTINKINQSGHITINNTTILYSDNLTKCLSSLVQCNINVTDTTTSSFGVGAAKEESAGNLLK